MENGQLPTKFFASQYQPSTFEDRGTTVPFTTPLLSCARVRKDDRHNLVLLTPGFAGTQSVYVLPWRAIPELVTMTVHDRALHEAIQETGATSPDMMRRQALAVAATGLAGPGVQAAARKAVREDSDYAQQIHAVLTLFLLHGLGIDVSALAGLDLSRSDVIQQARSALQAAATPLGVELETLYQRMGMVAGVLNALGLVAFGEPGRLRNLLAELKAFHTEMNVQSNRYVGDAAIFFRLAAEAAQTTITPAEVTLEGLDRRLQALPDVVRNWQSHYPKIVAAVTRLSWLLDGWDYVMGFASGAGDWNGHELWENLDTLARMLPLIPRGERQEDMAVQMRFSEMVQRRRVIATQDWRTGALDQEMARRLEAAKSAALEARA